MSRATPTVPLMALLTLLFAGTASQTVWNLWAGTLSPLLTGHELDPEGLIKAVFGLHSTPVAKGIHIFTGVIAYPIGFVLVARPVARILTPFLPWWVVGIGFGMGLFVFGMYVMAHLVAGMPAFLGWSGTAFASLAGHILFGLTTATVFHFYKDQG